MRQFGFTTLIFIFLISGVFSNTINQQGQFYLNEYYRKTKSSLTLEKRIISLIKNKKLNYWLRDKLAFSMGITSEKEFLTSARIQNKLFEGYYWVGKKYKKEKQFDLARIWFKKVRDCFVPLSSESREIDKYLGSNLPEKKQVDYTDETKAIQEILLDGKIPYVEETNE